MRCPVGSLRTTGGCPPLTRWAARAATSSGRGGITRTLKARNVLRTETLTGGTPAVVLARTRVNVSLSTRLGSPTPLSDVLLNADLTVPLAAPVCGFMMLARAPTTDWLVLRVILERVASLLAPAGFGFGAGFREVEPHTADPCKIMKHARMTSSDLPSLMAIPPFRPIRSNFPTGSFPFLASGLSLNRRVAPMPEEILHPSTNRQGQNSNRTSKDCADEYTPG